MALIPFIGRVLSHIDREVALVTQKSFCYLKCSREPSLPHRIILKPGNYGDQKCPFLNCKYPVLWLPVPGRTSFMAKESARNYVLLTAKSQKRYFYASRQGASAARTATKMTHRKITSVQRLIIETL